MAYGDESPLVGLNYVRAAVTNLTLEEPPVALASLPYPLEEEAVNGHTRTNSSILNRLAEKLRLH